MPVLEITGLNLVRMHLYIYGAPTGRYAVGGDSATIRAPVRSGSVGVPFAALDPLIRFGCLWYEFCYFPVEVISLDCYGYWDSRVKPR